MTNAGTYAREFVDLEEFQTGKIELRICANDNSDRLGSDRMQEIQDGKRPTSFCFARHNSLFEIPNTLW